MYTEAWSPDIFDLSLVDPRDPLPPTDRYPSQGRNDV